MTVPTPLPEPSQSPNWAAQLNAAITDRYEDAKQAAADVADTINNGRLSKASLTSTFASKASEPVVDTSVGTRVFVGDVMIYGDTGTRDVGYENVKDGAQTVFMRRVGEAVYAYGNTAPIPDSGNTDVAPVPVGFRPRINARFVYSEAGEHPEKSLVALRSGNIRAYGKAANGRVQFHAVWDTDDPWPTTLPGTPA